MIKLDLRYLEGVQTATTLPELCNYLQDAIELEHATIPAYLSAMMSIKPGTNTKVFELIHSVVIEEMLHMSIACNVMNALGGSPDINKPGFVPDYPGPLPMGIGNDLIVRLVPLSTQGVHDIYMAIEEPEDPINFPVKLETLAAPTFATIGQFYQAIQAQIKLLCPDGIMPYPGRNNMTSMFPPSQLFAINTVNDAINAINIIIEQGEGTKMSPLDPEHELAHYYRFAEIYYAKQLVPDKSVPQGYSYSGTPITIDTANVFNTYPNTKLSDLHSESEAWNAAAEFSQAYSRLLNALHVTFNGSPDNISHTLGMMYDVKLLGEKLAALPFPGKPGYNVGPTFEYISVLP